MLQSLNNLYANSANNQKGFLCFRKPGNTSIHFWSGIIKQLPFNDIDFHAKDNLCVLAPFNIKTENCLVMLPHQQLQDEEILRAGNIPTQKYVPNFLYHKIPNVSAKNYFIQYVDKIRNQISNRNSEKIVAARSIQISVPQNFHAPELFMNLCAKYPNAFVYVLSIPGHSEWIGASPELLLKSDQSTFSTVSLAGSQAALDHTDTYYWGEKELEEQALVTRYIKSTLENCGIDDIKCKGPYTSTAGHIAHLKTDISTPRNLNVNMQKILALLHPTPAVCGLPKESAMSFIQENENLERSYYSGFLGLFTPSESECYVNIRCLMHAQNHLHLYAGCGVLSDSDPEKEWLESEMKMQTLLSILSSSFKHTKNG